MANVTYLLGAGASANCLPTYVNFFERFRRFGDIFKETNQFYNSLEKTQKNDVLNIRRIIDKILEEFQFHNTPDTIAKKYFHSNLHSPELTELKEVLILFFLHQQILKQKENEKNIGELEFRQPLDKRYDAFLASLLKPIKGKIEPYEQFKILTWNYDLQFEIAYSRYLGQNIPYCQKQLQSYPSILSDGDQNIDLNKFSIVHLNGVAYARGNSSTGHKDFLGSFFNDDQFVLAYLTEVFHSLHTVGIPGEVGGHRIFLPNF